MSKIACHRAAHAAASAVDRFVGAIRIDRETGTEAGVREALLDRAFGPGRYLKTSERMRAGRLPLLSLVARDTDAGRLVGSVRLWSVALGDGVEGDGRAALMLGPLGVDPNAKGAGVGSRLMRFAIAEATFAGHAAIILVGDPDYYERFGFCGGLTADLRLPGPVEQRRFLGLALRQDALTGASGLVRPTGAPAPDTTVAPLGLAG
jgi:predicted N-acetyltransferase YhbS